MVTRKPEPTDWVKIINAIFAGIVLVMMTFFGVRQHHMVAEVEHVKKNTDGAITAALTVASNSAKRTAQVTNDPQDEKLAEEAMAALKAQIEIQRKVEEEGR